MYQRESPGWPGTAFLEDREHCSEVSELAGVAARDIECVRWTRDLEGRHESFAVDAAPWPSLRGQASNVRSCGLLELV